MSCTFFSILATQDFCISKGTLSRFTITALKSRNIRTGWRESSSISSSNARWPLAAADLLEQNAYDLILLDVMLPEVDGFELMEYIRPMEIPVIFLTAKGSVHDRVKGLRLGAEDYIVKPFDTIELLARIDVVLRRYRKCDMVIETGGLRIDTASMRVWRGAEEISLMVRLMRIRLEMGFSSSTIKTRIMGCASFRANCLFIMPTVFTNYIIPASKRQQNGGPKIAFSNPRSKPTSFRPKYIAAAKRSYRFRGHPARFPSPEVFLNG